ncbi:unnamed protein product [Tilletia controversa]|nr:hypothetical protein CF328_g1772 [Tilletia controversa]CAD6906632.1 unnamed protein product [Tilletia controversa]CAD6940820.1 unnamed protein product [Tilletia controversa]CAD6969501.1 unnamed protein product [Tilletia controversa]
MEKQGRLPYTTEDAPPYREVATPAPAPAPAQHSPYRSQQKPLPIPYSPPSSSTTQQANTFLPPASSSKMASYPPSDPYPNPHTTTNGQHDYTDAYNNAAPPTNTNARGYSTIDDSYTASGRGPTSPNGREAVPATGPTKGVGVPSAYNAFITFPLLSPWYPSTPTKPNQYYDPLVSGPRVFPPPLAQRGLDESRLIQIQHFACSIRADSQRNKGLLCCGLGILLGGLGCVLIDNKCVGNTPLRDQVNRWAFENVNPRLEHDGIDVRFAYQKGALRAYFKDQ